VFMEGNFEAIPLLLDAVWDVSLAKHIQGELPESLLAGKNTNRKYTLDLNALDILPARELGCAH
jgi:hypothetical protein